MKKIFITTTILVLLLNLNAFSQNITYNNDGSNNWNNNKYNTIIGNNRYISHGAYFGVDLGHTMISHRNAFTAGVDIAWVIGHTIELGVKAKGFISSPKTDPNFFNYNCFYTGGYGGLLFAVNVLGSKPVNLSIPVLVGWGGIAYLPAHYEDHNYNSYYPENFCSYFVFEPGLDVQFNMTRFFRMSVGVSYRHTSDIYMVFNNNEPNPESNISNSALRGFNVNFKFKFGRF